MNSVTAKEMYEIDRKAMEDYQISGAMLMENAGRSIVEKLVGRLTKNDQLVVLAGGGNNGGDGFSIARTLFNLGYQITVIQLIDDVDIKGDAREHKSMLSHFDCKIVKGNQRSHCLKLIDEADFLIDAMLGIGFKGELREPYLSIVEHVNDSQAQVIAVDIPSGIPADSDLNIRNVVAVQADLTYCIEAPKPSAFIERFANYYGEWEIVKIGLPKSMIEASDKEVWTLEKVRQTIPKRAINSHKGSHGRGLVIGGSIDMPGAVRLSAKAALRSGVGLLTVATMKGVIPVVASDVTEATFIDLSEVPDLEEKIACFDAVAIGMGMGRSSEVSQLIECTLNSDRPLVIDADGLNSLIPYLDRLKDRIAPTILTPHPGEMSRLTGLTVDEIKDNPFKVAYDFATVHQVYLILKGVYTIVTTPEGKQTINTTGNPALAKGGSGDCLVGIILAQMMQKGSLKEALANACYLHGLAADIAIEQNHTPTDFLASDLIEFLPRAFRTCSM